MFSEEGKLFAGGLNFQPRHQAPEDHFSSFRPVSEVVAVKDRETQQSQGFGFITLTNQELLSSLQRKVPPSLMTPSFHWDLTHRDL
uniref:RRM domain-containing protein n=1 Tax=Oryctolagus cuniculus TaxID=9986 RepID=G1TL38_RABIT